MKKKEISLEELAVIIDETSFEAQLLFWQKPSDYQKGLVKNLRKKGFKV